MLKYIILGLLWVSAAFGQTYTQMQWGVDKSATPYNFGANIGGTWRPLGTVTSTGEWAIPATCDASSKYGFSGDGATDNSAKFSAWVASLNGASGCLHFGSGTFNFSTLNSITLGSTQSITIVGDGPTTELRSVGAHGLLSITYPGNVNGLNPLRGVARLRGLRITTDQTATQTAIYIDGKSVPGNSVANTLLDDLTFEGTTSTTSWDKSLHLKDVASAYANNIRVNAVCINAACTDTGVYYEGSGAAHPTDIHVSNMMMIRGGYGVYATGDIEGVFLHNVELVGIATGVKCVGNGVSGNGICSVIDSHINCTVVDIDIDNMNNNTIIGNKLYGGARAGMPANAPMVKLNSALNTTITGNTFQGFVIAGTYPNGIEATASGIGTISGNTFTSMNTAISLDATSSYWSGAANSCSSGATPCDFSDTGLFNIVGYKKGAITYSATGDNNTLVLEHGAATASGTNEYISRIIASGGGVTLWAMDLADNTDQSGGLTGSNFSVSRYSNTGVFQDTPFTLEKATGNALLANSLLIGGTDAGSGTNVVAIKVGACSTAVSNTFVLCAEADGLKVRGPSGTLTTIAVP